MSEATFKHGNPLMVDYTPVSAVAAGEVVEVNDVPFVCHTAIAANELGALAAGGGVYEVTTDGTTDTGGDTIYWDDTANKVTTTSAGNPHWGYTLPGQGATSDGDLIHAIHRPSNVV